MQTNVTRGFGNVLQAKCWKHNIAMYQRMTVATSQPPGGNNQGIITIPVWTCPACEAEKASNARSN